MMVFMLLRYGADTRERHEMSHVALCHMLMTVRVSHVERAQRVRDAHNGACAARAHVTSVIYYCRDARYI